MNSRNQQWARETVKTNVDVQDGAVRFRTLYVNHPIKGTPRRVTAAIRRDGENKYTVAFSMHNPCDTFSRLYGQAVALRRLDNRSCFYLDLYDEVEDRGVSYLTYTQQSIRVKQPLSIVAGKNLTEVLVQLVGFWLERHTLAPVQKNYYTETNRETYSTFDKRVVARSLSV